MTRSQSEATLGRFLYVVCVMNVWNAVRVFFDLCMGWSTTQARARSYRRCAETCRALYDVQPKRPAHLALCNHVSLCDMFVDALTIDPERTFYVARYGTIVLPMVAAMKLCEGAYLFRRGGGDRKAMYEELYYQWYKRDRIAIVYPEGTRNPTLRRLPLKFGMLKFAYDYDIPVVVYMSSGKEQVMNERKFFVTNQPTRVVTLASETIRKADEEPLVVYVKRIQRVWDELMDFTPGYEKRQANVQH